MPNIAALKMQNPLAIPAFLALSTEKSPTRFHEDPEFMRTLDWARKFVASELFQQGLRDLTSKAST
jgi:hypothetical protein